ncbi:MAG: hypothetical protein CO096_24800 [Armatimonadetes bacterium CG_4_9_14_3_um_filter_66_14]|nr:MAG: hypothetical protein CO096_24800 [Armatimonadetes bacterium CG_4_9_14_3_um_filter_66_14]
MRAKYLRSAHYQQKLKVRARITEWEHRLRIDYQIRDAETALLLTRAHTIQVAVSVATGEMCYASPAVLLARLGLPTS